MPLGTHLMDLLRFGKVKIKENRKSKGNQEIPLFFSLSSLSPPRFLLLQRISCELINPLMLLLIMFNDKTYLIIS